MSEALQFKKEDRVLYFGAWGAIPPLPGTITGKGKKNGRAVFDVELENGVKKWGYGEQFLHAEEAPLSASSVRR